MGKNINYEDCYIYLFSKIESKVSKLQRNYNNTYIEDLNSYLLIFIRKMLNTWETIFKIYNEEKDYISAFCLIRNIADNISIINLIYLNSNENEKIFRHYLYILDGINNRIKSSNELINRSNASKQDLQKVIYTQESDKNTKRYVQQIIKTNPLCNNNNNTIRDIIEKGNWKYKSLTTILSPKEKNQYTWKDLYMKVNSNPDFANLISYLSIYVHGLSYSNIEFEEKNDILNKVLHLGVICLNFTDKALTKVFESDLTSQQN